jgi:diadenylate cyclase
VLLISLPVIFQPEIRRALEQLGQTRSLLPQLLPRPDEMTGRTVDELVKAATQLARHRYGALIVLEQETGLQNYVERGVPIDGLLTRQLLINLFYPNSPLHDGAAVVRDGRIVAASVVLPLSDNTAATSQLGTRHRAALGITEQSDAIAVVVSEETGQISVAENGRLIATSTPSVWMKNCAACSIWTSRIGSEEASWLGSASESACLRGTR